MKYYSLLLFAGLALFTACDDEEPIGPGGGGEEEIITTLTYTLTPQSGGDVVTLNFEDLDGNGGNAPTITGGTLAANTTYTGAITLLNASKTPAENITEEIEEEDDEHQFFFNSTVDGLTVAYDDADDDGNPVGLQTEVTTGDAASGDLTVILLHEPAKDAEGVADGDIDNADGDTDIDVTFPVTVQ